MRLKLFLLLLLSVTLPAIAQKTGVSGAIVDNASGSPIAGASIMLGNQGVYVETGVSGDFRISNASAGKEFITIAAYGYRDVVKEIELFNNQIIDLGTIRMDASDNVTVAFYEETQDMLFDQSQLEDEDESTQAVGALSGASDNIYYSVASYDFQPMYFKARGYNSEYQSTYINGIYFNDMVAVFYKRLMAHRSVEAYGI